MENILLDIEIDKSSFSPKIYQQLVDAITEKIMTGVLKSGMLLPSTRRMADQLHISRKSVVKAIEILIIQGFLVSKDRSGIYVADPIASIKSPNIKNSEEKKMGCRSTIDIDDGFPDSQLMPYKEYSRAYRKLFDRAAKDNKLGYKSPLGHSKLRKQIAEILGHNRALSIFDDEICIVKGAQMALFLVANAYLKRGDHIAIESPGYFKALEIFEKAGLNIHHIPVDEEGVNTDMLEELCKRQKIRAVYVTPRHQYPTTVKLSNERRNHLCELSENHDFLVIEDDFCAEFQYTGKHILPLSALLDKSHYIYIGTFSKIFVPAIRVGYIHAKADIISQLSDYRSLIDLHGDLITERVLSELFEYGYIRRHIKRANRVYAERLEHVDRLISDCLNDQVDYKKPHGGLAIWLTFAHDQGSDLIQQNLLKNGINIPVYNLSSGKYGIRIGYASMNNEMLDGFFRKLAKVFKQWKDPT